ncbi:hypothetical protein C9374_010253 [Naegleria lovaniensis]|uniref:Uncharacterized protein n=1 Tax=Naegleria lovaniensis TaxID=51637 RepID=A0AA88GHY0_NAELO|nr:uncharacterized protein C9374_010253 [Naegleria lovaniensis]KAG2374879.1 hypothetical protein C9374_010253 [Naegleria lovaniensis]
MLPSTGNNGETLTSLIGKSIAILVVFLSAWFGALLPFVIKKFKCSTICSEHVQSFVLSFINCLSGGFFISASFYHILPSAAESFKQLNVVLNGNGISKYNSFPYMIASLGFMIPLLIHNILNVFTVKVVKERTCHDDHASVNEGEDTHLIHTSHNIQSVNQNEQYSTQRLASYVLSTVLSCQSVLIGITSGVIVDIADAYVLICTMILHKWVAAFSISVQSMRANMKFWNRIMPTMLIFSTMTPLGIFIGILLVRFVQDKMIFLILGIIFKGLGSGFFIYVSTMIILRSELAQSWLSHSTAGHHNSHSSDSRPSTITTTQRNVFLLKLVFVVIGYLIMTIPYSTIGKAIASS